MTLSRLQRTWLYLSCAGVLFAQIDVRDYGVKGDGVTDDTSAFQKAIDAAGRGGKVYVPRLGPDGILINGASLAIPQEGTSVECASMDQRFKRTVSGAIFSVQAGSNSITDCGFIGNRTPGSVAITSSGARGRFTNLRIDTLDGGVLNTGGFHNEFGHIWGRNMRSYLAKATDGVSPTFHDLTHDTDAGLDIANEACVVVQTEGVYVHDNDLLGCRSGVRIEAVTRNVTWIFVYDTRVDQAFDSGVSITNSSAFTVQGVFLNNVWMSATGMGRYTYGGLAATGGVGLSITRDGPGALDWVECDGCILLSQRRQNVKILGGVTNVTLNRPKINGANQGKATDIDSVYLDATGPVTIDGGTIFATSGDNGHRSAIGIGPGSGMVSINSVRFDTALGRDWRSHDAVYSVASTPTNVRSHGFSPGLDDVPKTLIAAATVNLPLQARIRLSGNEPVDRFLPTWQTRKLYLENSGIGTVSVSDAGNVASPFTLVPLENALCEFTGSKWICIK